MTLLKGLEKCCKQFQSFKQYKNDSRYVRVWLKYVCRNSEHCSFVINLNQAEQSKFPSEIYSHMNKLKIGVSLPLYYKEWALYYEKRDELDQALKIVSFGKEK